jgi:broad specificity phosphatase PhoE
MSMENDPDLLIVFETHATSLDNEARLASGWFDVDLSATGEEQARSLGVRRRGDDLAAVCCSDLTRAVRTAEIAFGHRVLPILRDARLRECHYGALSRCPVEQIDSRRSAHVAEPFPGGESYQDVVARVSAWLGETAVAYAGRTVLVVGHRATFYALEHLLTGVALAEAVAAPWQWQPGWTYRMSRAGRGSDR